MKILSIDTSTSAGSISFSDRGQLLGEVNINSGQTHSVRLLRGVETLLSSLGLNLREVDAFAVVSGPGSFTGVRIGLATVKGLAEAISRPTIAVSAFDAWVEKFPEQQGVLIPMIDARRGEIYGSVLRRDGHEVTSLHPCIVQEVGEFLASIVHDSVYFVGGGSHLYASLIHAQHRIGWSILSADPFLGRALSRIAWHRARQGSYVMAKDLQAYYLRRSDAELKWKDR